MGTRHLALTYACGHIKDSVGLAGGMATASESRIARHVQAGPTGAIPCTSDGVSGVIVGIGNLCALARECASGQTEGDCKT